MLECCFTNRGPASYSERGKRNDAKVFQLNRFSLSLHERRRFKSIGAQRKHSGTIMSNMDIALVNMNIYGKKKSSFRYFNRIKWSQTTLTSTHGTRKAAYYTINIPHMLNKAST